MLNSEQIEIAKQGYAIFKYYGYNLESSAGILGNLHVENGGSFDPTIQEVGGGGGVGIAQWTPSPSDPYPNGEEKIKQQARDTNTPESIAFTLDGQFRIVAQGTRAGQWLDNAVSNYDYISGHQRFITLTDFKALTDVDVATVNFMTHYLRPSYDAQYNHWQQRVDYANAYYDALVGEDVDPPDDLEEEESNVIMDWWGNGKLIRNEEIANLVGGVAQNIVSSIENFLSVDLYDNGDSAFFSNSYVRIQRRDKTYHITPNINGIIDQSFTGMSNFIEDVHEDIKDRFTDGGENGNNGLDIGQDYEDAYDDDDPQGETPINPIDPNRISHISYPYGWGTIHGRNDFHDGIDYVANINRERNPPIYAVMSGEVVFAGEENSLAWCSIATSNGKYIVIKHRDDDYYSLYLHNIRHHVSVGQKVAQGQHIADMGSTGCSTIEHLHFSIRNDTSHFGQSGSVDPSVYGIPFTSPSRW